MTGKMYKTALIRHEAIADSTMAFHFEKPADFSYHAGQSGDWVIPGLVVVGRETNKRSLSLASSPYEEDLMVAVRMRPTAFKRHLGTMQPGDTIELTGPFGELTLHDDASRPAVFLAGGIGITPFHSIIRQAVYEQLPHKFLLFYSNHQPADAPFMAELEQLASEHPQFELVPTMTDLTATDIWSGERGFIDEAMLTRYIADLNQPIYYAVGPVAMVVAMNKLLLGLRIDHKAIRTEIFTGY